MHVIGQKRSHPSSGGNLISKFGSWINDKSDKDEHMRWTNVLSHDYSMSVPSMKKLKLQFRFPHVGIMCSDQHNMAWTCYSQRISDHFKIYPSRVDCSFSLSLHLWNPCLMTNTWLGQAYVQKKVHHQPINFKHDQYLTYKVGPESYFPTCQVRVVRFYVSCRTST